MHGWTNGRRLESRPISSHCEPSAQVSKNAQILYIAFVCYVKRVNLPTIHVARLVLGYVFGILKEKKHCAKSRQKK